MNERLHPFHKHWPDDSWQANWSLYWLPATFTNEKDTAPDARFASLLELLLQAMSKKVAARQVTFFDSQLVYPYLTEHMVLNALDYLPLQTMGFCPGKPPVRLPRYEDVSQVDPHVAVRTMKEKDQAFRMQDIFPNMPRPQYHIFGDGELARQNLMGRGGYTVFVTRDSHDVFTGGCKELLAENTPDPMMEQLPLAVPLFDSSSFLNARVEQLRAYFGLFDLYVAESPADKGILIASSHDLDELLMDLVESCGYRAADGSSQKPRRFHGN